MPALEIFWLAGWGSASPVAPPPPPILVTPPGATRPVYDVQMNMASTPPAGIITFDVSQFDGPDVFGGASYPPVYQSIPGVQVIHIRRGRQTELGTIQPGTCTVLFDNARGWLSPQNASSPYFPNVLPGRQLRVLAGWQGVTSVLYEGYVEDYTPVDNGPVDADMSVTAIDWLGRANRTQFTTTFAAQSDADRIVAILAGVPRANPATYIDEGVGNVVTQTTKNAPALSLIQDVNTATRGLLYVRADGGIAWESRRHRLSAPRSISVQLTLGQVDGNGRYPAGIFPYVATNGYVLDAKDIKNEIRINATATAEGVQVATDQPSIDLYGKVTYSVDSPVLGPNEAAYQARFLLSTYKDPSPRVSRVVIDPDADDALWPQVLTRDISDRIHVTKRAPGSLQLNQDMFIEGVNHDIKVADSHIVTWDVSDARLAGPPMFTFDVSQFGGPDVLAY